MGGCGYRVKPLMPMPMMNIRKMWMAMLDRAMGMHVTVRHRRVPLERVFMLMVFIVDMPMPVFRRLMLMCMGVALGQVQPHPGGHQRGCNPERAVHRLAQYQQGQRGAEERRGREISAGTRTAQPA